MTIIWGDADVGLVVEMEVNKREFHFHSFGPKVEYIYCLICFYADENVKEYKVYSCL